MSKMGTVAIKADDLSLEKYKCYFCDLNNEQQEEIAAEAYAWYAANHHADIDETPYDFKQVAQL